MNRIQLGIKLKEARNSASLTQEQLAERFKTDPKKISRIERGVQFPEEDYLNSLNSLIRNELDIEKIQSAILEIQSLESSSAWKYKDNQVSNNELLFEIKAMNSKLDTVIQHILGVAK